MNITIRDVNNHAPEFSRDNYLASIAENTAIGNATQIPSSQFRCKLCVCCFECVFPFSNFVVVYMLSKTLSDTSNDFRLNIHLLKLNCLHFSFLVGFFFLWGDGGAGTRLHDDDDDNDDVSVADADGTAQARVWNK